MLNKKSRDISTKSPPVNTPLMVLNLFTIELSIDNYKKLLSKSSVQTRVIPNHIFLYLKSILYKTIHFPTYLIAKFHILSVLVQYLFDLDNSR